MNLAISILFFICGIGMIVYNARLAKMMYTKTQLPFLRTFRDTTAPDRKSQLGERVLTIANRVGIIFGAVVLIFIAFSVLFGPIVI